MMNSLNNLFKTNINYLLLVALAFFLSNCGDDDPVTPPNEEELITTVVVTFIPQGGGTAVSMRYFDEDGPDGPTAPTVTGGTLAANSQYDVSVTFTNESETPAEDITEEVEEEGEEHQLFFAKTAALNLSFAYADMDGAGNPIGLSTIFTTGDASTGQLTVILRHEPDKNANGVSTGDITNAGGETDIETTPPFDIVIQ